MPSVEPTASASRAAERGEPVLVSVLVPVLNEAAHIRETVTAMRAQRVDGGVELLFMDGRSEDETRAILEDLARGDPRLRVLDNPARTTPAGLNVGLRHARGRYVARMDGHTIYPPDYLARGIARLERGDVDWVSGPQVPHGTGRWSRRVALALSTWLATGNSKRWGSGAGGRADGEFELDTGVFAGVWRRSTLEAHGGWAEGWPINQDSELAARILKAGGRIVCVPEMSARYFPRDSLRALAHQYWRYGQYRAKTARHHPESLRRSLLLPPGLALTAAAAVAAPRPLRRLARSGTAAYACAVGAAVVEVLPRSARRDAAALALVIPVMHMAWGSGFLAGCVRFGPPLAALARVAGASRQRLRADAARDCGRSPRA